MVDLISLPQLAKSEMVDRTVTIFVSAAVCFENKYCAYRLLPL